MPTNVSNPKSNTLIKRAQSRHLSIDEFCIENLSMYAMAVYMQLRLLSDFSKAYDEIKISIEGLSRRAKISTRKVYHALNELENEHYLIQRLNYHHFRYGQVNAFNVARDYNFFKPSAIINQKVQESTTPAQNDSGVQNFTTPAPYAVPTAPYAGVTAQNDIPKETRSFSGISSKKQKQGTVEDHVTVFSCKDDIKNHVEQTIAKREVEVEDEIVDQIVWYAEKAMGNESEIKKRVNIGLKKVREGKWNIPQGYNGITSQSIREKEQQHDQEKQALYQQEAKAFKEIAAATLSPFGAETLLNLRKKLGG